MKRIALISLAAIAALVSCQKEEFVNESQAGNSPVFIASIATDGTKTTLSDDSPAKIYWESSDKITIIDASSNVAVYTLSAGEGTKSGTFVYESGTALDASSTYTATYGAAPSAYQVYSSAGSVPLYMTAPATSSTDGLVFTAQCGVLRVTLTDASHDIMRVEVSDGTNTYKVTSTSAVDASPAKFYLALPAGTYTSLNIYDDNFQMVSKTGIELTVTAGHVKPAVSSSLSFTDCTTKGFRGTHAVVQLWAGGPFWAENNIGADTPEAYGQYFAWGYITAYSWTGSSWSPAITFDDTGFSDYETHTYADMATAAWGTGWSAPTNTDLSNLISSSYTSIEYVKTGTKGIRVTGTTSDYTSNSIFLPAAGFGNGSSLEGGGDEGDYWSSVQDGDKQANCLYFSSGEDPKADSDNFVKYLGFSVRPVCAPAEPVLLPGNFSVSATKQVQFTRGNLYWDGSAYHIEGEQNVTYTTLGQSSYTASHVCHFFWTNLTDYQSGNASYMPYASSHSYSAQSTSDKFFCGVDNPMTVDGQSNLYALTGGDSGEWKYLFSTRTNASNLYKTGVSVTTSAGTVANCLVIAPDGYTETIADSYDSEVWAVAEAAGLVCLPATGCRYGTNINAAGDGYWSATPRGEGLNTERAYYLKFDGSSVTPSYDNYRYYGYCVRLVSTVSSK